MEFLNPWGQALKSCKTAAWINTLVVLTVSCVGHWSGQLAVVAGIAWAVSVIASVWSWHSDSNAANVVAEGNSEALYEPFAEATLIALVVSTITGILLALTAQNVLEWLGWISAGIAALLAMLVIYGAAIQQMRYSAEIGNTHAVSLPELDIPTCLLSSFGSIVRQVLPYALLARLAVSHHWAVVCVAIAVYFIARGLELIGRDLCQNVATATKSQLEYSAKKRERDAATSEGKPLPDLMVSPREVGDKAATDIAADAITEVEAEAPSPVTDPVSGDGQA